MRFALHLLAALLLIEEDAGCHEDGTAATTAPMNVMNFRIFFRIEVIPVVMHFAFLLG